MLPAPYSQTYNVPVYNNMITASLLDVTLAHTTNYSMWSHPLYSSIQADDALVTSYCISVYTITTTVAHLTNPAHNLW